MTLAAIGNANDKDPVDCSSIRFFASKRMRLSMAASFTAHIAVAAYLAASTVPHGISTATSVKAFNITLVDLEAPHVVLATAAPGEGEQNIAAKPSPNIEQKPAKLPVKPVEAPRPTPIAVKSKITTPEKSDPVAPPHNEQSVPSDAHSATTSSLRTDHSASIAASNASIGRPEKVEPATINEARYRSSPTPPRYPKRARELNQQGEALLHIRLDPHGNAEEILVWRSSGYVLLDNAALAAARRWEFEPERRGGRAVIAWVKIPVRFSLH